MSSKLAVLTLVALSTCCSRTSGGRAASSLTVDAPRPSPCVAFVFVAQIEPGAGGLPGASRAFYAGRDGRLQVSRESTSGELSSLRLGNGETDALFELVGRIEPPPQRSDHAPGEVSDYTPAKVAFAWLIPGGEYRIESHPRDDLPAGYGDLLQSVTSLVDEHALANAIPGLYLRAQRIPRFDPRIQKLDLAMTALVSRRSVLAEALEHEMALVRIGDRNADVRIAEQLALRPGRPLHVQSDGAFVRLITFDAFPKNLESR